MYWGFRLARSGNLVIEDSTSSIIHCLCWGYLAKIWQEVRQNLLYTSHLNQQLTVLMIPKAWLLTTFISNEPDTSFALFFTPGSLKNGAIAM